MHSVKAVNVVHNTSSNMIAEEDIIADLPDEKARFRQTKVSVPRHSQKQRNIATILNLL